MVTSRRHFIAGIASVGIAGSFLPGLISMSRSFFYAGAKDRDGYAVYAINRHTLLPAFRLSMPARVHGFAHRPNSNEVVVFARRPGEFAIVFDGTKGNPVQQLRSLGGRHFYGHGTFSHDGKTLFASENAYDHGVGMIGVYNAEKNYRRIGEFRSGGIGPHEIKMLNRSNILVVANGGIKTHPDTGRSKLNLEEMVSNLSYIHSATGEMPDSYELPISFLKSSIRHIDITWDDDVVFAMQYYGPSGDTPQLFGVHRRGKPLRTLSLDAELLKELRNYCGSVAVTGSGRYFAVSAPRGNKLLVVPIKSTKQILIEVNDGCGVLGYGASEFLVSSGQGLLQRLHLNSGSQMTHHYAANIHWDNHLG